MKKHWKFILLCAGVAFIAFLVWEIYRAIKAGVTDIAGLYKWIFNSASSAVGSVADGVSAAASLPGLVKTGQQLDTTITNQNNTDYAPGGRIYNNIVATQGQAAADAAWVKVQADDASMTAQTGVWYNPLSW